MKGVSYVINLERRPDRLERFTKFYNEDGPSLPLEVFKAIDGTNEQEFERVPQDIKDRVSQNNDFKNSGPITATAYSHLMVWSKIAQDYNHDYGMIYEDDCYFRNGNNNLKTSWPKLENSMPSGVLYFGVGDMLPIHTNPPSESMLRAQEIAHVQDSRQDKYFWGKPNFKCPYVFPWVGCSSMVLSRVTAQFLLDLALKEPLQCAIDAWLVRTSKDLMYFSIPLFTYCPNRNDSDTWDQSR